MPITRKIIKVGHSRAMTLPATWIQYYENEAGEELREVAVEVDGKLTISPIKNRRAEEKEAPTKTC